MICETKPRLIAAQRPIYLSILSIDVVAPGFSMPETSIDKNIKKMAPRPGLFSS